MGQVTLKDIVWGGRIRRAYQGEIWRIATQAAVRACRGWLRRDPADGDANYFEFLDGKVWEVRGYFNSDCGMFWQGCLVKAYILYRLGLDPRVLLKKADLPPLEELERRVQEAQCMERGIMTADQNGEEDNGT